MMTQLAANFDYNGIAVMSHPRERLININFTTPPSMSLGPAVTMPPERRARPDKGVYGDRALWGDEYLNVHDKESFFWLLFWVGVHWNGPDREPSGSEYDCWNTKRTRELAREKAGTVGEKKLFTEDVEGVFTAHTRPRRREARQHGRVVEKISTDGCCKRG